jgi:hypothetical protein
VETSSPGHQSPSADVFAGPPAGASAAVMNHQCMMAAAFATVRLHLRPQEVHCAAAVHRSRASGVCPRAPIGNRFENHYTHLLTSPLPVLHPPPSIPFALQLPHLRAQMRAHLRTLWQTDGEERRRLCSRRYKALTCTSYSQQVPGRKSMHMEVVVVFGLLQLKVMPM